MQSARQLGFQETGYLRCPLKAQYSPFRFVPFGERRIMNEPTIGIVSLVALSRPENIPTKLGRYAFFARGRETLLAIFDGSHFSEIRV
jgi:hypothetical protein